jgi:hypothetical protein
LLSDLLTGFVSPKKTPIKNAEIKFGTKQQQNAHTQHEKRRNAKTTNENGTTHINLGLFQVL